MKNKSATALKSPPVMETQAPEEKSKFVSVPVDVAGKIKGKNYVALAGISYNHELGNLSLHLSDKHTLIFKDSFKKHMKVEFDRTDRVEQAARKAPSFDKPLGEKSQARMKLLGERDGRTFLGVSGSVKFDGSTKGLMINLDDKHMTIVDSEVLSKELGIAVRPVGREKEDVGIGR